MQFRGGVTKQGALNTGAASTGVTMRATTTQRGYGAEHQTARRHALDNHTDGDPCGFCGQPMYRAQRLDLDHTTPLALGGDGPRRLTHAKCNRAAGARIGNRRRVGRAPLPPQPPKPRGSRDW